MEIFTILIFIILVVVVSVIIYQWGLLQDKWDELHKIKRTDLSDLEKFTTNLKLDPFPSEIDISNEFSCTPEEPRLCDISDGVGCFGCKNFTARCNHLSSDVIFYTDDGEKKVLPKNESPDKGYCLAISHTDACNPYHGNLTFVKTDPMSLNYGLICDCKNPGLISNSNIDSACETAQVCNGKVKDLNTPIEEMVCICDKHEVSENEGYPRCKIPIIKDYDFKNNTQEVNFDAALLAGLDTTIFGNLPDNAKLRDPCKYCAITGKKLDSHMVGNKDTGYTCASGSSWEAMPIRLFKEGRILMGNDGPDGVIHLPTKEFLIKPILGTNEYRFGFILDVSKIPEQIITLLGIDKKAETVQFDGTPHQIKLPRDGFPYQNKYATGYYCKSDWPTYYRFKSIYRIEEDSYYQGEAKVITTNKRKPPGSFLWGTDDWVEHYKLNPILKIADGVLALTHFSDEGMACSMTKDTATIRTFLRDETYLTREFIDVEVKKQ